MLENSLPKSGINRGFKLFLKLKLKTKVYLNSPVLNHAYTVQFDRQLCYS